jgi:acyl-CoA thioesterase
MSDTRAALLFDLAPSGPNEWRAAGTDRFAQPNGSQFGGYVSGLMMAAILAEPERRGAPVSMTGSFLYRVTKGPLTIRTKNLRTGGSLAFWQAEIVQDGKLCAQSTITLALRPEAGPNFGWVEMPSASTPEQIPSEPPIQGAPGWREVFDQRWFKGWPLSQGDSHSLCWAKEVGDNAVGYPELALFADMFPPRVFLATGNRWASSTISFSTYFHANAEEVGATGADYILLEGRGRRGSYGTCDVTAALWRRDGLLLATTEQLCWFR